MSDNEAAKSSGPPDIAGLYSLKLDNLDFQTNADEIREMFVKYGEIGDVYVPRDHVTKQARGFAFVRYKDRRDAEDALKEMHEKEINGREVRVSFAEKPRAQNPREPYMNSNNNGSFRGGGGHGGGDFRGGGTGGGGGYGDRRMGGGYGARFDDRRDFRDSRGGGGGYDDHRGPPPSYHDDRRGPPPSYYDDRRGPPPSHYDDRRGPPPPSHYDDRRDFRGSRGGDFRGGGDVRGGYGGDRGGPPPHAYDRGRDFERRGDDRPPRGRDRSRD